VTSSTHAVSHSGEQSFEERVSTKSTKTGVTRIFVSYTPVVWKCYSKGTIVPCRPCRLVGGSRSTVPLILNLGNRWRRVFSFTFQTFCSRGKSRSITEFPGCVPQLVWTFWKGENLLSLSGIKPRLLGCVAHSLVTVPTARSSYDYDIETRGGGQAARKNK
jgi:hypothetical protein